MILLGAVFLINLTLLFYLSTIETLERTRIMSKERISTKITKKTHKELQLLCMIYDKNMLEMLEECVLGFQKNAKNSKEMKDLKHRIYRLKYDAHKNRS